MFLFRTNFDKVFLLLEIWRLLSHFSIRSFLNIYDYMLKKRLTISISNISTFSMVLCLFLLHLMEIFPKVHDFSNKNIVKHCSTIVKYFDTTINTKFPTVNHYLTSYRTKNWLPKEHNIMSYDWKNISSAVSPNFYNFCSSIKNDDS